MKNKPYSLAALLFSLSTVTLPALADPAALQAAYRAAVSDAAVAEPDEISRNLIAITPANTSLVWQGEAAERRVLMVTWTNWTGYDDKAGQAVPLTREIWATAVPELRTFCQDFNQTQAGADTVLRLEQLLGLPPQNGKTRFVELWVDPADLFRPSPDPEITDHEAQIDFPASRFLTVSADHINWINKLKSTSYGDKGYPWTALGYTYDWGNADSEVGLSEFVIRAGATVTVQAIHLNQDYCQPTTATGS